MNTQLTEIIFLLDRSGSMADLTNDTIGGFNGFIKKQAEMGETRLTTVLFDDHYEILHNGINAADVRITDKEYFTRGCTALLDAIGKTIADAKKRIKALPEDEKPGKVIFVITTDGLENASREFTYGVIKEKIEKQAKKHGWEFIFMGANIDVAKESKSLGIKADHAFKFTADHAGVCAMFASVGNMTMAIRNKKAESGAS
ncbi:hypothetical protein FACS189445_4150 [Spirochaetia bacterium]|nr:hypothetical protein FACS189445_4150 [Spirochaetia bacterium]